MMGLKVEILVHVHGLPADRGIQTATLSSSDKRVEERVFPIFFLLHSELDGWPDPEGVLQLSPF